MNAPESPERLWVVTSRVRLSGDERESDAFASKEDADGSVTRLYGGYQPSEPQEYIRADIAAAEKAAAEAKYKGRDVEVMRVALADLRRIRTCLVARANSLRTIGEESRAMGLEDAIKQLDEEVFT